MSDINPNQVSLCVDLSRTCYGPFVDIALASVLAISKEVEAAGGQAKS